MSTDSPGFPDLYKAFSDERQVRVFNTHDFVPGGRIERIPAELRQKFCYELALRVLLDELLYSHFPKYYEDFRWSTDYPKLEFCGHGYRGRSISRDPWSVLGFVKWDAALWRDVAVKFLWGTVGDVLLKLHYVQWPQLTEAVLGDLDIPHHEAGRTLRELVLQRLEDVYPEEYRRQRLLDDISLRIAVPYAVVRASIGEMETHAEISGKHEYLYCSAFAPEVEGGNLSAWAYQGIVLSDVEAAEIAWQDELPKRHGRIIPAESLHFKKEGDSTWVVTEGLAGGLRWTVELLRDGKAICSLATAWIR